MVFSKCLMQAHLLNLLETEHPLRGFLFGIELAIGAITQSPVNGIATDTDKRCLDNLGWDKR